MTVKHDFNADAVSHFIALMICLIMISVLLIDHFSCSKVVADNQTHTIAFEHNQSSLLQSVSSTSGDTIDTDRQATISSQEQLLSTAELYFRKGELPTAGNYARLALLGFDNDSNADGLLRSYKLLGDIAYDQFQYDSAIRCYNEVAEIYRSDDNKRELIRILGLTAEVYRKKDDFKMARSILEQVLQLSGEIDFKWAEIMALNGLGSIASATNNPPEAIIRFNDALILAREEQYNKMIAVLLHNIGALYVTQGNLPEGRSYLTQAYQLYEINGDKRNMINCLNDLGSFYKENELYDSALVYFSDALSHIDNNKPSNLLATLYNNLGHLNIAMHNPNEAIIYLRKGFDVAEAVSSKERILYSYLGMGKVKFKLREFDEAQKYAMLGLSFAGDNDIIHLDELHELLSDIYAAIGNYQKAYKHHRLFKAYTDNNYNAEVTRKVTRLESEYKFKEAQLLAKLNEEKLISDNEKAKEHLLQLKSRNLQIIVLFLALGLILIIVLMNYRVRNLTLRTRNALIEQKLLRSQMTPHFLFNSLSVLQGIILNKEFDRSIRYLSGFSGLMRLSLENSRHSFVRLQRELQATEAYLTVQNTAREIPFEFSISLDKSVERDFKIPPMMIQPFIENAIKHGFRDAKTGQYISISFSLSQQVLVCKIIDNGLGITHYRQHYISEGTSCSTELIKERLETLSKIYKMKYGVVIQDRNQFDQQGTEVTLHLPIKPMIDDENTDS